LGFWGRLAQFVLWFSAVFYATHQDKVKSAKVRKKALVNDTPFGFNKNLNNSSYQALRKTAPEEPEIQNTKPETSFVSFG